MIWVRTDRAAPPPPLTPALPPLLRCSCAHGQPGHKRSAALVLQLAGVHWALALRPALRTSWERERDCLPGWAAAGNANTFT